MLGVPDSISRASTNLILFVPDPRGITSDAALVCLVGSFRIAEAPVFLLVHGHVGRAAIAFPSFGVVMLVGAAERFAGPCIWVPILFRGAFDALTVLGIMEANSALLALVVREGRGPPFLFMVALDADVVSFVPELVWSIAGHTFSKEPISAFGTSLEGVELKGVSEG